MILIDSNEKVNNLLRGLYSQENVIFYNSNEIEIRPDYDYSELKAKTYTEVTGNLNGISNLKPNHHAIVYPWFWLVDTIKMCWQHDLEGTADMDQYWQTTREPCQLYTCMLGQKRPHRQMIFDLLINQRCSSPYLTFAGIGMFRDVVEHRREDVDRCVWSGENQVLTHRFPPWYDHVLIDLVVETHEDAIFYTEKTWKPFLGMRLPMIFGAPFIMKQLMEWGFRFPLNIVDYSFDNEPHPYLRAKSLVSELKRLREEVGMNTLHTETLGIRKYNQRRCFELLDEIELPSEVPELPQDVEALRLAKEIRKSLWRRGIPKSQWSPEIRKSLLDI